MCGISGFVNTNITEHKLCDSVKALYHRGPDGAGLYQDIDNRVSLGHARLSIIDLETGDQPITSSDDSIVLVCNGEVYDFESIRTELKNKGYQFKTKSDSEVILYLYQEYGIKFLKELRGEFSFILFDRIRKTVYAVKDRFGIKPLYYVEKEGQVLLGSEAKAIFASGLHNAKIDPLALRDTLSFVNVNTVFEGIQTVPPGCYLEISLQGKVEVRRYWDIELPKQIRPQTLEEAKPEIRHHLDEAVKTRLRADVPVGVYLSGGIDSAIIASTVSRLHPDKLKTFTICFNEVRQFDEAQIAQKQADAIGAESHTIICNRHNLFGNLEDSLWNVELPALNLHGVGKFLLSKLARQHVKVVLTGEGADEVFLGYPYFKGESFSIAQNIWTGNSKSTKMRGNHRQQKEFLKEQFGFIPQIEMAESFSEKRQGFFNRLFSHAHRLKLKQNHPVSRLHQIISRDKTDGLSFEQKRQFFSIKGHLASYILTILGDRQEMANSIEGRVPFLDHKLFEYARTIPVELKVKGENEKYVLKEAFKDRIIPEIYNRTKHPFSAPPLLVLKKTCPASRKLIEKYLSQAAIKQAGIFNVHFVRGLQIFHRLNFWSSSLKNRINSLLLYILTSQMLHDLFVVNLVENINQRCPELNVTKYVVHSKITDFVTCPEKEASCEEEVVY
ncbi:asparagine synthase (glutamine-hydrolyzing) [Dongshaea marina]|uniref:asparagine synthase (glutamine-hydrolyzing) n=1 Tax=Dongshaea marina TaxID=2047966 RepID=UPI000D3EA726|nr:asparagine synthase (glutamine-hydrolyzing) [Dongshaea marina]